MDAYPLTSEEVLFRDCMLLRRIPEETMVDFRRCNMSTTAELMSVAGGVLGGSKIRWTPCLAKKENLFYMCG
jgi:hypothetical protein